MRRYIRREVSLLMQKKTISMGVLAVAFLLGGGVGVGIAYAYNKPVSITQAAVDRLLKRLPKRPLTSPN